MISFEVSFPEFDPNWLQKCKDEIVKVIEEENRSSWKQEQNPNTGAKWPARKQPTGSWPLLNKTGRMFGQTKFEAKGGSRIIPVRAQFPFYGQFHQNSRPWLGVPPSSSPKIGQIIAKNVFK
jgi:hypothetical protein